MANEQGITQQVFHRVLLQHCLLPSMSLVIPCSEKKNKKLSRSACSMFCDHLGTLDHVGDV